jgi:hypothetical protein
MAEPNLLAEAVTVLISRFSSEVSRLERRLSRQKLFLVLLSPSQMPC